jgi:hypothetical protein
MKFRVTLDFSYAADLRSSINISSLSCLFCKDKKYFSRLSIAVKRNDSGECDSVFAFINSSII